MTFSVTIKAKKSNEKDYVAVVAVFDGQDLVQEKTRYLNSGQRLIVELEDTQHIVVRKHRDPIPSGRT